MIDYYRQFEASLLLGSKKDHIEFRPGAKSGFWLVALLPTALLLSLIKFSGCSPSYHIAAFVAIGSAATIRGQAKLWAQSATASVNDGRFNLALVHQYLAPSAIVTILVIKILKWSLPASLYVGLFGSALVGFLFPFILRRCPKSFTFGEAALITQAVVCSSIGCVTSLQLQNAKDPVTVFHQCLLLCGFAYVLGLALLSPLRRPIGFYCWLIIFTVSLLASVKYALRTNPFLWVLTFITEDSTMVGLIAFWVLCSLLALFFVLWNHNSSKTRNAKELTRVRKAFHLLIILVYIPGLAYDIQLLYLASGAALAAFVIIESLRICQIPPFQSLLNEYLRDFLDEKDQGCLILTPIYLLVGCSLPLWIAPTFKSANLLFVWAGVVSLGIGDSAASLGGSLWGKYKWPNSEKSMEGTLCSVASQLIAILIFNVFDLIPMEDFEGLQIVLAVVLNALCESLTSQVDNLVIPLCFYLCLI